MRRGPLLLSLAVLAASAWVVAFATGAFDGWLGGEHAAGPNGRNLETHEPGGSRPNPDPTPNDDGDDDPNAEPVPLDPVDAGVGAGRDRSRPDPSAAGSKGSESGGVDVTAGGSDAASTGRRGATTGSPGSGTDRSGGGAGATKPGEGDGTAVEIAVGTISGRVVRRSDGLIIAGAAIRAFPHNRGPDQGKWTANAGDDGTFTIAAVPVGRYGVEATYGGHSPEVVAGVEVVEDHDTALGDLVLASGALLHGRVTGADQQPRAGLTIRVFAAQQGVREVPSAPDGTYRIAGLAPANYFVEIRGAQAPDRFPVRIVTLALGEARTLDFGPTPGVALTVTVLRDGAPVEAADVRFVTRAGTFGDVGLKLDDVETDSVKTDASGQVRFADLQPGPYDLLVTHRDHDEAGKKIGPNRAMRHAVVVPEGGPSAFAITVAYPSAQVRGTVVDAATGTPIAGARIAIESGAMRASRSLADKLIAIGSTYASTDAKGEFTLAHVAPGAYSIAVVKPGYAARAFAGLGVSADGVAGLRIELTPGEAVLTLTVQVGAERAVQGSFAVLRNAAGADVGLVGIPIEGTVDFKGLAAGVHTLLLYVPNRAVIVREGVTLVAGETTALTVDVPE